MPEPLQKSPDEGLTIIPLEDKTVRRIWDKENEKWLFAVVDLIAVLTKSKNPAVYWRVLKQRLSKEGSNETVTNCNGLKLRSTDGKMRITDVADVQAMFRIIQSVPSPKAEPIKLWLAKVGSERIEEFKDPEKAIHRAVATYAAKGRDETWINQRLRSIEGRHEITTEWKKRGINDSREFALLTNLVYVGWSGMTSREYKEFKGLKDENLRDHMTTLELVLNMLAEATTAEIARTTDAQGMEGNSVAAQRGGKIAGDTRQQIEEQTKKPIISRSNYLAQSPKRKRLK